MSVSLKFHCCEYQKKTIEVSAFQLNNTISITIEEKFKSNSILYLDRSTAIKLSKELRKAIALLD
jgi:hypothetical protein